MSEEVYFRIEDRGPNNEYKVVIDNYNCICGVYSSYVEAKKALSGLTIVVSKMVSQKTVKDLNSRKI